MKGRAPASPDFPIDFFTIVAGKTFNDAMQILLQHSHHTDHDSDDNSADDDDALT